ncbi:DUF4249 domain-containing protein [Lutibacter flavus]|uniref:DUF4249 domain-containing protein n=1 Tax=Lutibacter flavus TaxID=691689 RepID=A0A238Y7H0_9FLAO|nr:DUF4249 domain-containing protein [Lutibacter flavus]SNR66289.1 protein of unknown function [Lutibacter flavus]
MKGKKYYIISILIIGIFFNSCTEPFDIKSITFESALVVEATISNEFKHQEINLSRTFNLEEKGPSIESNAVVKIIDDLQNIYSFHETTLGKYVSNEEFSAVDNRSYQLKIITNEGKSYASQLTQLTNSSQIDKVSVEKSEDGNGVNIFVDSYNPDGNSRYYRFEYEETYKIVAPKWSMWDLVVISDVKPYEFDFVLRDEQKRICYNTIDSKGIILTETNNLVDDKITKFPVRYISRDNYLISHRYSMLLKQYVQSQEAFTFYKTLNDLSGSENLFSQNQPGFVSGNVFSEDNSNEKVIGFFEVSSVSTKRIFFNPRDLDLSIPLPTPYPTDCTLIAPELDPRYGKSLFEYLDSESLKYFYDNDGTAGPVIPGGPYVMVPVECGDCTKVGTNIAPEFWVE